MFEYGVVHECLNYYYYYFFIYNECLNSNCIYVGVRDTKMFQFSFSFFLFFFFYEQDVSFWGWASLPLLFLPLSPVLQQMHYIWQLSSLRIFIKLCHISKILSHLIEINTKTLLPMLKIFTKNHFTESSEQPAKICNNSKIFQSFEFQPNKEDLLSTECT